MNLLKKIVLSKECLSLFLLLLGFSLLRLPSLFEPNWYGDEGIYQVLGHAIREGRTLYSGIWDNKPPLLYLTYALVNANQFWIRFLSYVAGLLAVYVFYLLSKRLFTNTLSSYLSTGMFAMLFATPTTEANIANAENFMLVFLLAAGLLVFSKTTNTLQYKNQRNLLVAGILVAIAFLYKIVAIFDFASFFLFLLFLSLPKRISLQKDKVVNKIRPALVFAIGFLLPILFTAAYFLFVGAFLPFLSATFTNNVSYVGYKNYFLIPQGLLITKLLILGGFVFFLFRNRHSLPKTTLFILLWFAFSLFNTFFSQRPYTHYVLVVITSLSYLFGLIVTEKKYRRFTLALLVIGGFAILITFGKVNPIRVFGYYGNFLSYISGQKSTVSYQSFFDNDVPRDYEIAQFLSSHLRKNKEKIIFIWGNTAQIYTLSGTLPPGRFTVAYHISSTQAQIETQQAIDQKKPQFIVLLPDSPTPQISLSAYAYKATIGNAAIYERAL